MCHFSSSRQNSHSVRRSCWKPLLVLAFFAVSTLGQSQTIESSTTVPALVKYSGTVSQGEGSVRSRLMGLTFALYKEQTGGTPLWLETQNVQLDNAGHYTVQLGSTQPNGLPKELFASGEARWLGVQPEGQAEQPRVLLLSVPYALKAADAETIGGLPPSAFVLAASPANTTAAASTSSPASVRASTAAPAASTQAPTSTLNYIPIFTDNSGTLGNSAAFQTGTGTTAKIGINTTTPSATLDVKGTGTVRGLFTLPSLGVANATKGSNSQPIAMTASAFNSGTAAAVNQSFRWQAEPAGNNTASPAGTLNLLFGSGTTAPAETGLKISNNGLLTFATGQTFPGTGKGTITSVTAGPGLTGGGSGGDITIGLTGSCGLGQVLQWNSVTWICANVITNVTAGTDLTGSVTNGTARLNLDTTKIPQLNVANTFTGNQTVNGNLSATGVVTGSGYQIGSVAFAFGSVANSNAFLGFSGNATTTGTANTASGSSALSANTSGSSNTASGVSALAANTTGSSNTASGDAALESNSNGSSNTADGSGALISNTTGVDNTGTGVIALGGNTTGGSNTGIGFSALVNNTTGSGNTAVGYSAGPDSAHPNLNNATAIGANAVVTASNALVLGATGTNVGIGTSAPAFTLDVHGSGNFTGPITFAAGQTFPGTGTITGITPGTALTGGGSSGSVTLNVDTTKVVTGVTAGTGLTGGGTGGVQTLSVDTTKVAQLAAANTFTGNQTVNGNLSASGTVNGSSYQIGGNLFAFGSYSNSNVFTGFSGNTGASGNWNTGSGASALLNLGSGTGNTGIGYAAGQLLSSNSFNTGVGKQALAGLIGAGDGNTQVGAMTAGAVVFNGSDNTFIGANAGAGGNATFSSDTTLGYNSLAVSGSGTTLSNATAIGAQAAVTQDNSLILGSINGVNSATADTSVGIGTTAPATTLDVEATWPALVGPIFLLKNKAPVQSGTFGNSVDFRFALDGGSSAGNPNAYIRAAEDGNSQYGSWISFATMADGGSGIGALERMRIAANGFVGIGVSPVHIFQVGQGLGNAFADGWSTYSSRRWKTNIQTLPNALEKVEQLRGVAYDLKGSGKHEIGVIAEEVGQVVPEVVSFEENGKDAQGVDYSRLTALLIEAVKEQQRQIQREQTIAREEARELQKEQTQLAKALHQIKQQQSDLREQAAAMRSLKNEVRKTRETLRKLNLQVTGPQPGLVAAK